MLSEYGRSGVTKVAHPFATFLVRLGVTANGITLTGGGSLLHGMDRLLEKQTKIHTALAEDPVNCVAIGTGKSFQYLDKLVDGFVIPSMQRF